jgi:large subunit ribosomal protein L29
MKAAELRELSPEELEEKARERREELFNAKVKHATGQLENTARLGALRKEIARLETVLAERQKDQ